MASKMHGKKCSMVIKYTYGTTSEKFSEKAVTIVMKNMHE